MLCLIEDEDPCLRVLQYSPQKKLALKINIDGVEKLEEGTLFSEATFIS